MTLNEVMKDTADAIREKTGKSEKIAPVDFASEIKGITAGGEELEGDYFLAKANEYYWKPNSPMAEKLTADMPEYQVYRAFCVVFTSVGAVFEGVRFNGERCGYKDVNYCIQYHCNVGDGDNLIYNPIIAVRESDIDNPNLGKYRSLVDAYKTITEIQGTPMTEEEVVALLGEQGITRITKEEFEALITA